MSTYGKNYETNITILSIPEKDDRQAQIIITPTVIQLLRDSFFGFTPVMQQLTSTLNMPSKYVNALKSIAVKTKLKFGVTYDLIFEEREIKLIEITRVADKVQKTEVTGYSHVMPDIREYLEILQFVLPKMIGSLIKYLEDSGEVRTRDIRFDLSKYYEMFLKCGYSLKSTKDNPLSPMAYLSLVTQMDIATLIILSVSAKHIASDIHDQVKRSGVKDGIVRARGTTRMVYPGISSRGTQFRLFKREQNEPVGKEGLSAAAFIDEIMDYSDDEEIKIAADVNVSTISMLNLPILESEVCSSDEANLDIRLV